MKKIIDNVINLELPTKNYAQLARFVIAGGITASLDFFTLYLLVHLKVMGYFYASAIGFLLGSSLNYLISIKWVFYSGKFKYRTNEYILFIILTSIGLLINQLVMYLAVSLINIFYLIAKLMALVIVTAYNFIFKKFIVFKK